MRLVVRRTLCLVPLLAVLASGCTSWGARQRMPEPSSTERLPDPVRIRTDGGTLVLHRATVSGDSIVGYTGGASDSGRAAVALAEVREVEGRQVSFLKTAGTSFLVTTGVVVALVIVWIASL